MLTFIATIYKEGMNYVVDAPDSSKTYFQKSGYIPVRGIINKEDFKGTLIPREKNRHVLFVNWDIRTRIDKSEFDKIEVSIEYDPESRDLPVPEDVELILSEDSRIYKAFLQVSPSQRREMLQYVISAKKTETRLKRIQKIADHFRERLQKKGK